MCFGIAAAVGIPSYLLARSAIGNTGAMFLMMGVALPAFLLAMYEKDGLPFEKVVRNVLRAKFLRPGVRPYQTENIYAPFTQRGAVRKEDAIAERKKPKRGPGKAAKRKAALSAQQTIPYLVMHPDGVCQLPGGLYTKTVEYEDINYSVASTEDQTAIFGGWSAFLNYFDSSLPFQLSFINRRSRSRSKYKVNIPPAQDDYDSIRAEFTSMLKNQIAKSNNGIERSKYITFGLPAEGIAEARPRLERVEADVTGNLKRLGVPSAPMDGQERLALLHSQMHPGSREPFRFSWQDIPRTGMGTKDFIAPDSFDFRQSRTFRIGPVLGRCVLLADFGVRAL